MRIVPAPFNPTRRNRNIGTPKQGHGQNNRMVVPQVATATLSLTARLDPERVVKRQVNGKQVTFIVERTSGGCTHACSVEDVALFLSHTPLSDWVGLDTIVFRQSTRKLRTLNPAWGRLFYHADLGFRGSTIRRSGPAVFLEAVDTAAAIRWSTALDPEDAEELERLRMDGHRVDRTGRHHVILTDTASVRATQLYRTLPHEIGHWFDWLEKVEAPLAQSQDHATLADRYFARPKSERESFAHRYADGLRKALEATGAIPFAPIPQKDHGAGHEGE